MIQILVFRFYKTRSSSGDEMANVNFLYDDIVKPITKYNRLAHKFRHRSTLFVARHRPITLSTAERIQ